MKGETVRLTRRELARGQSGGGAEAASKNKENEQVWGVGGKGK